jgi:hypothetical protein
MRVDCKFGDEGLKRLWRGADAGGHKGLGLGVRLVLA